LSFPGVSLLRWQGARSLARSGLNVSHLGPLRAPIAECARPCPDVFLSCSFSAWRRFFSSPVPAPGCHPSVVRPVWLEYCSSRSHAFWPDPKPAELPRVALAWSQFGSSSGLAVTSLCTQVLVFFSREVFSPRLCLALAPDLIFDSSFVRSFDLIPYFGFCCSIFVLASHLAQLPHRSHLHGRFPLLFSIGAAQVSRRWHRVACRS
jgi:hypothetical protein